tara:strand:+ start:59422 stop:66123 length:6702 start_codon:yes stop_codon:yes gene_type:complete
LNTELTAASPDRDDRGDDIAIIGIGCRFPGGADNPERYWDLLKSGTDAISETPADRWSLQKYYASGGSLPGKTQSKWGGYVDGIDQFDPQLFGISPREAASMDPQQRLLLEVTWRAFEDAGQRVENIAGSAVSVFTGISSFDYAVAGLSYQDRGVISPYSNTGGSSSIAANRISYCFDLRGPSVAVDTACSSSLVAVHMACESLKSGDCEMALAGGVNALILPDFYVAFSQLGVLSPDGRCKTFDARANGYVRSEGAGMVLMKPLRAAVRDGDSIYAVIRATALNQDGRTQGMTVPSQSAQETLLRSACQRGGVKPADIQYVEAHGTGTPVGDPIEANALASVLNHDRPADQPCWIGSVKTNIGHLEAGAGIASLIKVALSLKHQQIPAHLHFEQPNPQIDFQRLNLRVPRTTENWNGVDGERLAGINGFGYGGANAHLLLQEAPVVTPSPEADSRESFHQRGYQSVALTNANGNGNGSTNGNGKLTNGNGAGAEKRHAASVLLPISARSPDALADVSRLMADWLDGEGRNYPLHQIASNAAYHRSHQECRSVVTGATHSQCADQLREIALACRANDSSRMDPFQIDRGVLFVCSGQGPQWWAMGRGLLNQDAVFRQSIERCDREFAKYVSWSLVEELSRAEDESRMQETSVAQPCIFAIQVALAAVWESRGIRPSAVVGHSVGEIAAAYLSGALTWQDACCVAIHRGRTMDLATSKGAMIAAGLSADETASWIKGHEDKVALAAVNGPTSVTISGDADVIERLAQKLKDAGIFCRQLVVEYAFHSPQMDPVREPLLRCLANIRPRQAHTPIISTVTGQSADGDQFDAEYWWKNVRQSVCFADAMQVAADEGFGIVIEIGPHPVLAYSITECFQKQGKSVRAVPSLHRERDDATCMTDSLGSLYAIGMDLDWTKLYQKPAQRLPLPAYPFQRQRCWSESFESKVTRLTDDVHPLLGESTHHFSPAWQNRIDLKLQDYLDDHRVRGACMLPAAAMIEMSAEAARQVTGSESISLQNLQLQNPCMLSPQRGQHFETVYRADRRSLEVATRPSDESNWTPLATVEISGDTGLLDWSPELLAAGDAACDEPFTAERCYAYCQRLGLEYGNRFQGIAKGTRCRWESIAEVDLTDWIDDSTNEYNVHPAVLDSCFHAMITADADFDRHLGGLYLPSEIGRITLLQRVPARVTTHVRLRSKDHERMVADIDILDEDGQPCLLIRGFVSQRVGASESKESIHDLMYRYQWIPSSASSEPESGVANGQRRRWCIFADRTGVADRWIETLRRRGDDVVRVDHGTAFEPLKPDCFVIDPEDRDEFTRVLQSFVGGSMSTDRNHDSYNVVYLWGLDAPGNDELTSESLDDSTILTTLAPMHLVQGWEAADAESTASLAIVTVAAQTSDDVPESVSVGQSPLIGFGRVVISEYSRFKTKLIDLASQDPQSSAACLHNECIVQHDGEDEVMYRDQQRFVRRFLKQAEQDIPVTASRQVQSRLQIGRSSGIEELHYCTAAAAPLATGEVEIEVLSTGLNFSDVMKALDLYPGLPSGPVALGAECSGRISRVGPGVSDWSIGDEVIAVAPGSFASHVVVGQALVARKPQGLTHSQAATIPIAFLTAEHALNQCARMRQGDSVLIHSASGGVGLAAMQLAKIAGADVYATAGNDEKRNYVRGLGAAEVMDSRRLAFADQTLAASGGKGVDIVLNSLPGEAIAKGLSTLKTGGRFLEIGKRDIYANAPLGLEPFRNNLALFAIDLDQLFKQEPESMGELLRSLVPRFESGELRPLPITEYAADDTREAFRYMQQGKHIGKVVVNYDKRPSHVRPGTTNATQFRGDATYWLAGGLGGFGLEIAKWMVQHGAGNLVLSGRRESPSPTAVSVIEQLREQGANVTVMRCDITNAADVRSTLRKIDESLPRLRGVLHTAMVLQDRLLVDLDRETLQQVLRPKVLGGWNLHRETLDRSLDHFVLFSSLSSVFGHAGQANYSAANAMLDGLAHYRRSQELPACVMNWGHLGQAGYLAEREQLGRRLERQGVLSFTVKQATDCLDYALQIDATQLSVLRMDWSLWRGLGITADVSPRFAHLLRHRAAADSGEKRSLASGEEIRQADLETRVNLVGEVLRWKAGLLLGIDGDKMERDRSLLELGLDSLMAVEMRNWIESQIEINLPISALMRSASLDHLTMTVCKTIDEDTSITEADSKTPASELISDDDADSLLNQLPEMGDDEVSRLLGQLLRQQGDG